MSSEEIKTPAGVDTVKNTKQTRENTRYVGGTEFDPDRTHRPPMAPDNKGFKETQQLEKGANSMVSGTIVKSRGGIEYELAFD